MIIIMIIIIIIVVVKLNNHNHNDNNNSNSKMIMITDHQNFPTHPHYHGPGVTYLLGRRTQIGLAEPS